MYPASSRSVSWMDKDARLLSLSLLLCCCPSLAAWSLISSVCKTRCDQNFIFWFKEMMLYLMPLPLMSKLHITPELRSIKDKVDRLREHVPTLVQRRHNFNRGYLHFYTDPRKSLYSYLKGGFFCASSLLGLLAEYTNLEVCFI